MLKFIKDHLISLIANFLYLTGLSFIIPLSIVILFARFVVTGTLLKLSLYALFFVLLGAGNLYFHTRSAKKTLSSLGRTTLIPAAVSVLLAFVNERLIFATISFYVDDFRVVEPLMERYIESSVPHGLFLTIGYTAVGVLLLWLSKKQ